MAKKRSRKKIIKKSGSKLNYYHKPRITYHTGNLPKNYKSKKILYTILWFAIIIAIIILILLFLYTNLSEIRKKINLSPEFTGLPTGFTPKFGYWHKNPATPSSQGSVTLVDANGNFYFSTDGISFTKWQDTGAGSKTSANLSLNYKPVIGYYQGFPGQETVLLWDASRTIYAWSYSAQKFILISSGINPNPPAPGQLPGDFIPKVGYWHNFGGNGGRVTLFDSTKSYVGNSSGYFIEFNPGSVNLPTTTIPKVGYYYNISGNPSIELWYEINGQPVLYEYNPPNRFDPITPTGLPTNQAPTSGYFDKINNRIVLFYGDTSYESTDGINFARIGCIPQCIDKECGDDSCGGSCGSCASGSSCSNNICIQELTSSLCTDSDELESAYGYYLKGNVTYLQNNANVTKSDSCFNSTVLVEWSCEGDVGTNTTYNCPDGCSSSACTGIPEESCTDSDEGAIFGISGSVEYSLNGFSEINNDTCIDEITLKEYYCDDTGFIASTLYDCLSDQSCSDGECILIDSSNQDGNDNPPPTPETPCTENEETCDGDYYLLCANGQWLDPEHVDNKCGYNVEDTSSGSQSGGRRSSLFGNSSFWAYLIISLIIVIIIAGIVFFIIKRKKNKRRDSSYSPYSQQNQQGNSQSQNRTFEKQ